VTGDVLDVGVVSSCQKNISNLNKIGGLEIGR